MIKLFSIKLAVIIKKFVFMGNNFTDDQVKQTAHPQLAQAALNRNSMMLDIKVNPGVGFSNWKWNLAPFQALSKHLFVPNRFIDPELEPSYSKNKGCRQRTLFKQQVIIAQYQPYIFTLQKEILARKSGNLNFKQHQLWKILKTTIRALRDWYHAYPELSIGPITPAQVLFNTKGQIKILNRFSFIQENNSQPSIQYYPHTHTQLKYNQQTPLSLSIFSLGVTLLDTATLSQSRFSGIPFEYKKQNLLKNNIYPKQIKRTILGMIELDPKKRLKLQEIINNIKYYKQIAQGKQGKSPTNDFCIN